MYSQLMDDEDMAVEELASSLCDLKDRLVALERLLLEHLRASRQAALQEVGFLEQHLGTEPKTAELRDKARKEGVKNDTGTY